jgi:predicted phage terminase large subunit-like protein
MTAEEHLIPFTELTFPRYRTAPHHRQIAEQLERVERGEIDRLMLLIPPRHGKSELASRRFPAWYLGRHPEKQFISVSATAELAADFGRDVRNTIASMEYQRVFEGTRLAEDSQARGKWHTDKGGIFYALGIGGSLMGRGGDVLLVDDPFASMEDALSEQTRKTVWEWYVGTAYNRLQPGGAVVVINHRMHEDDLSGRLLAQQAAGGDKWEVVELPAISDKGEALWPDAYPLAALERIRSNTFPRFWSALYQQRPAPDEGTYFLASWLKDYVTAPERATLAVYGASDYAVTADGGDFTVHVVVGIDPEGHMYLLDMWRKQADSKTWVEAFCDLVKRWKPHEWAEETGQINAALGPFIDEQQRKHQAYVYRSTFPTRHDKQVRAQSIRGRMAVDGLYVPQYASWMSDLRSELLSFPAGKHDDIVDALGLIGQLLHRIGLGQKPEAKTINQFASGYRQYQRAPANNDAVLTA